MSRFEMANTVRTGRFFHAGTGGNLDLPPQDAILPERCATVHLAHIFLSCETRGIQLVSWNPQRNVICGMGFVLCAYCMRPVSQ
jgi:hypothetical protein